MCNIDSYLPPFWVCARHALSFHDHPRSFCNHPRSLPAHRAGSLPTLAMACVFPRHVRVRQLCCARVPCRFWHSAWHVCMGLAYFEVYAALCGLPGGGGGVMRARGRAVVQALLGGKPRHWMAASRSQGVCACGPRRRGYGNLTCVHRAQGMLWLHSIGG